MSTPPPLPGRAAAPPPPRSNTLWIVLAAAAGAVVVFGGMLAAIALPAYQDYTLRAKVSEAIGETAALKAWVIEHHAANQACPFIEDFEAKQPPLTLTHSEITAVGEFEDGGCGFEFHPTATARGEEQPIISMYWHPDRPEEGWDCTGGSLEDRYRPSSCREAPAP